MKKIICILIGLGMLTAVGCEKKSGNVGSFGSEIEATADNVTETEEKTEEIEPESYAPLATVRDRNIVDSENFSYEIYEGHVIITSYRGSSDNVEVPSEIEGYPVTEIGFFAFEARTFLHSVVLPDTVTKICEGAFMDCISLASVSLPDGLTELERGAFVGCTSLLEITLPASVTAIGEQSFGMCTSMTSFTVLNPELSCENQGLEELPLLTVYAPEGSAAASWASEIGKYSPLY